MCSERLNKEKIMDIKKKQNLSVKLTLKISNKRLYQESSSENEEEIVPSAFSRFIIMESFEDIPIPYLSLFIIERIISTNLVPKTVWKFFLNGTILIEVEQKILTSY